MCTAYESISPHLFLSFFLLFSVTFIWLAATLIHKSDDTYHFSWASNNIPDKVIFADFPGPPQVPVPNFPGRGNPATIGFSEKHIRVARVTVPRLNTWATDAVLNKYIKNYTEAKYPTSSHRNVSIRNFKFTRHNRTCTTCIYAAAETAFHCFGEIIMQDPTSNLQQDVNYYYTLQKTYNYHCKQR